ncbi:hypothetical protein GGI10_003571, partial [Coemansia sp. RSA 2530]
MNKLRRNLALATTLALLGALGYWAYETFKEPETIAPTELPPVLRKKRLLAISARGILLETRDSDKWSGNVVTRASGVRAIQRLSDTYDVYLIAVVRSESDQTRVLRAVEMSGLRVGVLFSESEEGKMHLARHLLTHAPNGAAGLVDTNRDVVGRLCHVLRKVVLVSTGDISSGDKPGSHSAFTGGESSKPLDVEQ